MKIYLPQIMVEWWLWWWRS